VLSCTVMYQQNSGYMRRESFPVLQTRLLPSHVQCNQLSSPSVSFCDARMLNLSSAFCLAHWRNSMVAIMQDAS
jgi:hypothetical protein